MTKNIIAVDINKDFAHPSCYLYSYIDKQRKGGLE